ncbi:DNA-dependent ATPase RAD26 ASCRUDRAFT_37803 [Ascoidea rubescens DSM 1968]|uniref:DNA helicase n=1 Tax=Ascoidea rubescens DSM 1968 TaxID=1344418 RepID=A0A1D2VCD1_9ASCO|nr:hypothetical protein ASCRUDRAFT_37803 [Ascoidea rubescens DSM 1968]ODV59291.1 hypothetical protein ASCRUDRAFT_37803 [Ascoidea rubescens DSM 1968]
MSGTGDDLAATEGLGSLGVTLVSQQTLENSLNSKANEAVMQRELEIDNKILDKTILKLSRINAKINTIEDRLANSRTRISQKEILKKDLAREKLNHNEASNELNQIKSRIELKSKSQNKKLDVQEVDYSKNRLPGESENDFLIRTGKKTAFGTTSGFTLAIGHNLKSHLEETQETKEKSEKDDDTDDGNEYLENEFEFETDSLGAKDSEEELENLTEDQIRNIDDGDDIFYKKRLQTWFNSRDQPIDDYDFQSFNNNISQFIKPSASSPDAILNEKFNVPGFIYSSLFDYQKTCVQWLWELYNQKSGGIIGDEMGLGKTIQIIAFLSSLHYSNLLTKPVLIVCPATVMKQWVNELHKWWPPFRVIMLHFSGSALNNSNKKSSSSKLKDLENLLEMVEEKDTKLKKELLALKKQENMKDVINQIFKRGHVVITTYVGLRIHSDLLSRKWGYCVLDEGHKIRNPNADISITCKKVRTYNRIILSGTPIQNNLVELWSLFDFILPGKLGTLPVFEQEFVTPIKLGGYANSTNMQVQTSIKCAIALKNLISPYLLRRLKSDVAKDLPKKNEMVLFCKLTQYQYDKYTQYLNSKEIFKVVNNNDLIKRKTFAAIDVLRKICNHPDLLLTKPQRENVKNYGSANVSGKMQVVKSLLQLWNSQNHKALLFCQTRQMLDILENQIVKKEGFKYLRMDGLTPINNRQPLVDTFNNDKSYSVFLLTTRVGGLGVNLTGADRIIIYDPDWNPSTDTQARERAWRLGQKNDVNIYRLMTSKTIEEKIYQRQIYKQFLSNKILKDANQKRFFKMNELSDLFTYDEDENNGIDRLYDQENKEENDETKSEPMSQVAQISGVSKLEMFKKDSTEEEEEKSKDEDRLLSSLLKNSGVEVSLKHDEIINVSKTEEKIKIEEESTKFAKQAISALRDSKRLARRARIGTPTWTGKFGLAGKIKYKTIVINKPIIPPGFTKNKDNLYKNLFPTYSEIGKQKLKKHE